MSKQYVLQGPPKSFHLPPLPLVMSGSLFSSTLQLSEFGGGPNHGIIASPPPEEKYLIQMRLIECNRCDYFVDGKHIEKTDVNSAGMLEVHDLMVSPMADLRDPFHLMHLHVTRSALAEAAYEMGYSSAGELHVNPGKTYSDEVARNLFLAVRPALASPLAHNKLFAEHALQALSMHIIKAYGGLADKQSNASARLALWQEGRLREIIDESLGDQLSLGQLANAVGLSARQLSRAFIGSFGMPPYRYLMHRRVMRGKHLLRAKELTLLDVALSCGFASQSHFTRVFKSLVGVGPGEWRRSHQVSAAP